MGKLCVYLAVYWNVYFSVDCALQCYYSKCYYIHDSLYEHGP